MADPNEALVEAMAREIEKYEKDPQLIRRHSWRNWQGHARAILPLIEAERQAVKEATPAIWRNGITNTIAVLDEVRAKHAAKMERVKSFAAFDAELDAALEEWFKASRRAAPTTYEEAEAVYKETATAIRALDLREISR